jgi:hypothetical protein
MDIIILLAILKYLYKKYDENKERDFNNSNNVSNQLDLSHMSNYVINNNINSLYKYIRSWSGREQFNSKFGQFISKQTKTLDVNRRRVF